ncbi:MFS transporter [Pseudobacteroides cellulosolvens]|uniref:Major facilitator superfamily MFS_1 n=1 Tax=Pseudobacteroides cellulosolvens ATCC 35603 = DSM 2933 TaxID=398512 RepID=A0A0L6JVD1_9FIRM|nr:MFS transporter [Pseudobacteroides cellulosolvens]KNY29387.1 major facilitator superfamily MFS_1 [Pseudobacteroides cellulosolvens ATCC 35603 = DSM 2933]
MEKIKKTNLGMIMAVYLSGIFMGAIDTGIVTPARTVIQNNLMVDDKTGIWMITIYTLAYAASIPIMGKMADKYGRKYIYLTSIFLFGLGSLICGLSQDIGNFSVLLAGRVIQALGGGGIVPVATAEFGTTFPPEKRGMALGLIGGVYGIANIFGASAGSAIMDIFGKNNWQFIFYINLPITLFILIAGFMFLSNNRLQDVKKTDISGILLLTVMILSLMYGLKNIDFFDFVATVGDLEVYPFLLIFIVLLPIFILVEKKAEDPVMNLGYFTNGRILVTLIISFVVGIVMMGMIFVPQFSENSLKIASGSGGYFVIILGLFAGVGAPLSGRLIDKFGAKAVLTAGFSISILGSLFLILVSTNYPNTINVVVSLLLIGLGMGFTIGAPLNYMMLDNTKKEESTSALATLSLVRSVGTVIGPAIMIGFLAHAGANIQTNVMTLLPKEITAPSLPYAKEISDKMDALKKDPNMKGKLADVELPDLDSMTKVKINMSGNSEYKIPDDLLELMKSSDVTTITENSKTFAQKVFEQMTPKIITQIQSGIQKGIDALSSSLSDMEKALDGIEKGYNAMTAMDVKAKEEYQAKMNNMLKTMDSMKLAKKDMEDTIFKINTMKAAVPGAFKTANEDYLREIDKISEKLESEFQTTLNEGFKQVYLTVSISSFIALIILAFYRRKNGKVEMS